MRLIRVKPFAWLTLIFAVIIDAYAVLALLFVASLSGAPNYSFVQAKHNEHVWGITIIICSIVAIMSVVYLVRTRRYERG